MSEENLYTFENEQYRHTYWHTCSHVMAQAVKRLYPDVKLTIGPSILFQKSHRLGTHQTHISVVIILVLGTQKGRQHECRQ